LFYFIKKTSTFLLIFILFIYFYFIFKSNTPKINFNKLDIEYLLKFKSSHFTKHIAQNKKINLLLGSSFIEDSIIPDSLGKTWFSFTNQGQDIYQSFKLLNLYKDSTKIDTIIIELSPFDFDSKKSIKLITNQNLLIKYPLKYKLKLLQQLKNKIYFNLNNLFQTKKNDKVSFAFQDIEYAVWSKQGFSGQYNRPNDLLMKKNKFKMHSYYFKNINSSPNFEGFNLFNSLTKKLKIKTIFIISPKSKNYNQGMITEKNNIIWNEILHNINLKQIELWNFEKMETDTLKYNFFYDDTHLSYEGAKFFTKKIKIKLNSHNY